MIIIITIMIIIISIIQALACSWPFLFLIEHFLHNQKHTN